MPLSRSALLVARLRRALGGEEGAVLVITVLLMPVMIAFLGLMLDGATLFAARRQLQDAADGAALAGAMQVDLAYFAQHGRWRVADTTTIPGTRTAHEAAQEICAAYGVTCNTDVPGGNADRVFIVTAQTDVGTAFIHLLTGQQTITLQADATAITVPGY